MNPEPITDAELERAFRLASTAGGEMLGIPEIAEWAGPESGTRLEFAAESIAQLVVDRPAPSRVLRGGADVRAALADPEPAA